MKGEGDGSARKLPDRRAHDCDGRGRNAYHKAGEEGGQTLWGKAISLDWLFNRIFEEA